MQTGLQRLKKKKHTIIIDEEEIVLTRPKAGQIANFVKGMKDKATRIKNQENPDDMSEEDLIVNMNIIIDGIILILPELKDDRDFAEDLLMRSGGIKGKLAIKMFELFGVGDVFVEVQKEAQKEINGPLAT